MSSSIQSRWYQERLSYVFSMLAKMLDELKSTRDSIQYSESQLTSLRKREDELIANIEELKKVAKDRLKELDDIERNPSGRN